MPQISDFTTPLLFLLTTNNLVLEDLPLILLL